MHHDHVGVHVDNTAWKNIRAEQKSAYSIRVCTYNLMLAVVPPIRYNGQRQRSMRVAENVKRLESDVGQIDVLVLQELISEHQAVSSSLEKIGFGYRTEPLYSRLDLTDVKLVPGGIVIFSRYPICHNKNPHLVFRNACSGADCFVAKGAVHCRIMVDGRPINLFGTHLQAWNTSVGRSIRKQQLVQMRQFIESRNISPAEPVVITGDFNMDMYSDVRGIKDLKEILGMRISRRLLSGNSSSFTSDPRSNELVGNDDDTMYSTAEWPSGCYDEYLEQMRCVCCPQEWLDYIGWSQYHLRPFRSVMWSVPLKARERFEIRMNLTTTRKIADISDHYPVVGVLHWSTANGPDRLLDRVMGRVDRSRSSTPRSSLIAVYNRFGREISRNMSMPFTTVVCIGAPTDPSVLRSGWIVLTLLLVIVVSVTVRGRRIGIDE